MSLGHKVPAKSSESSGSLPENFAVAYQNDGTDDYLDQEVPDEEEKDGEGEEPRLTKAQEKKA